MRACDRFKAIVERKPFDRLPLLEWVGWWDVTLERWWEDGLPRALTDADDIRRHFGLDIFHQDWFPVSKPEYPHPTEHGKGSISCLEDYDKVRPLMYPPVDRVVDAGQWERWMREKEAGDVVLWFTIEGFFWLARGMLGIEDHFYAFYDHPELLHRINSELADYIVEITEYLCTIARPDFMTFAEDMSYNHGSMLSKELFDEYMAPYYRQVIPVLEKHGIVPVVDTDGDVTTAAPWFEGAGLRGILPLERQAGVDIEVLRANHPDMLFIGHYDKMIMHKGEAALHEEFERLLPNAARGRFIMSVDHQTPPAVSYRDYRLYTELFREYAEMAGQLSQQELS